VIAVGVLSLPSPPMTGRDDNSDVNMDDTAEVNVGSEINPVLEESGTSNNEPSLHAAIPFQT